MSIKLCVLSLGIALSLESYSQNIDHSVLAVAGEVSTGKSVVLEWTLGESFVETVQSPFALYTQGFHQSFIEKNSGSKFFGPLLSYRLEVSPNPTLSFLNIKLQKLTDVPLSLIVTDINGKLVLLKNISINSGTLTIDATKFSAGAYFLRMIDGFGNTHGKSTFIKFL